MRISNAFFVAAAFCSLGVAITAQSSSVGTAGPGAISGSSLGTPQESPQAVPATPAVPSALLRPALDQVQETVNALKVDKWKKGDIRDEARDHINAISRDLQTTLPPLLAMADASPGALSKTLPVSRNVAALYDVLLSVVEAARVSGSGEDVNSLEQALTSLGSARTALDDRLQASAAAMEKEEVDLRSTLQAREAVKCPAAPAAPVCPAPAPVRKAKPKPKPPAKPAQPSTPSANPSPKTQN